jgi:CHAT domain
VIEPVGVTASATEGPEGNEGTEVPVVVTVRHGGFDIASYALMVGVYADEEMSGAERFLDRQFAELLSGWRDMGRYSGAFCTSVFAEPGRDVAEGCEPVGAHLIGLGSTLTLSRQQVALAVRSALVDRCVRLYTQAIDDASDPTLVGVSSALLGVRNDDGLRVEDAVTGTLEGVRDANRRLARFERERSLRSRVRVGFVEFVERYADRANLAAAAVRNAGAVAGLPAKFGELVTVSVTPGDAAQGALPSGAMILESDRTWRRFVISEQKAPAQTASVDATDRTLVVDVSLLGRDARADRVTHRIDRASLDALMSRISRDRSDLEALQALRDRLVPNSMRRQFLTSSAIQLIVDAATANYPWELLAASALGVPGQQTATGTGAVLRMFSEPESRRVLPERARVGTALVIGAGNVEGFPPLPGVIEEVAAVAKALRNGRIRTTTMVDSDAPLDIADLNVALYGDHQILHIASHGVHVDDSPDATGAILTKDLLFTVDVAGALPTVPELVFLNCCNIGRIGLNRLAAGLARELMALGVRAVVAAAWPVSDTAAITFAEVFYQQMTSGRSFGDAVTQARTECAANRGSATWAAYQCYGDPAFVLRGRSAEVAPVGDPVSRSDLQARLGALLTQIADLSQPKYGHLEDRRRRLRGSRTKLAEWAETMGYETTADVCRLLARTARELGDFEEAAKRYGTFATDPATGVSGLSKRDSSAFDLQQAANCLARRAQELARDALHDHDAEALATALATFPRAVALAEAAIKALPENEGHSILAGVYKKWATVDEQGRAQHLKEAVAEYGKLKSTQRGGFGVENRLQVTAILDPSMARRRLSRLRKSPDSPRTDKPASIVVDAAPQRGVDYWARAALGDLALTRLMLATTDEERAASTKSVVDRYIAACKSRSTFSERSSSVDHLRDLQDLLANDDERKPFLTDAWNELQPWSLFEPVATESSRGAEVRDAPPIGDVPARGSATLILTALTAACGDCLVLDYTGDDGKPRRVLVDGGLGSAFDRGLGSLLGAAESPTKVDVAVVSHVDLDHIEGTIRALHDGRLVADDIWFNGREQLEQLFNPEGSRGVRQGDALSKLIPDGNRNVVVGGRAFVVSAQGPPTTIELPGGATVVLLSPSEERLRRLLRKWPEPDRGSEDLGTFDQLVDAFVDERDRGVGEFGKDTSVANGSSIAFLFEHGGSSILFAADAFASDLETSIRALLVQRGEPKLRVRLFKLPHHGSRNNITDDLLDLIVPDEILVCTDGSKFNHPDEDALGMVRAHYPDAVIHFTDDTEVIRKRAAHVGLATPTSSPVVITL